ncbi:MAG: hypothetical protein HUU20_21520 [Pirellulales bacterium]|nr:hypothetical protein [Pirellulales bacterium]
MRRRVIGTSLAVLAGLALSGAARAQDAGGQKQAEGEQHAQFVRLAREGDSIVALETAIVRFAARDPGRTTPTVDLIAAVHIADKSYYEQLNRRFEQYDAVLYELVAPEGTQIPKGGEGTGSSHPVSVLQRMMTGVLDLHYQLQGIDYTKKNFVHADLSPERFAESLKRRGESMWTILFRMMGYAMAQGDEAGSTDARLLMALLDPNRALALKRIMAEQFQDLDGALSAIEGPDGSAIITDRNKAALEVLKREIDAGKRKIAIFYGGGHMPDFAERLGTDFGLVPIETQWLTAWNMK